ncbi:uncharacterized protein LOC129639552 [Bubalus kerabau]|uniref:uncharacterized protein LOC129639552 n=1 Tax=Bubalus carabanensis TaxID=3119969 RepID=UPI00244EAD5D|nr:uncharacterized protein LOC129639552 [Bubalus carabanensis]
MPRRVTCVVVRDVRDVRHVRHPGNLGAFVSPQLRSDPAGSRGGENRILPSTGAATPGSPSRTVAQSCGRTLPAAEAAKTGSFLPQGPQLQGLPAEQWLRAAVGPCRQPRRRKPDPSFHRGRNSRVSQPNSGSELRSDPAGSRGGENRILPSTGAATPGSPSRTVAQSCGRTLPAAEAAKTGSFLPQGPQLQGLPAEQWLRVAEICKF